MSRNSTKSYPRIEDLIHSSPKKKGETKQKQAVVEPIKRRELIFFGALFTLSAIILLAIILSTIFVLLFQSTSNTSTVSIIYTLILKLKLIFDKKNKKANSISGTQTTATTTTTTPNVPTYNEPCTSVCWSGTGLSCMNFACQCTHPR